MGERLLIKKCSRRAAARQAPASFVPFWAGPRENGGARCLTRSCPCAGNKDVTTEPSLGRAIALNTSGRTKSERWTTTTIIEETRTRSASTIRPFGAKQAGHSSAENRSAGCASRKADTRRRSSWTTSSRSGRAATRWIWITSRVYATPATKGSHKQKAHASEKLRSSRKGRTENDLRLRNVREGLHG